MARKTKEETERTRRRILDAARDLFIEKGYELATFDGIAKRIGFSKGAVYWHFKSKGELLLSLVSEMVSAHLEEFKQFRGEPQTIEEMIERVLFFANVVVNRPRERKLFIMLSRLNWASPKMTAVKEHFRNMEADIYNMLRRDLTLFRKQGKIKKDADVKNLSWILGSLWLSLLRAKVCGNLELDWEKTMRMGFELVLQSFIVDQAKA